MISVAFEVAVHGHQQIPVGKLDGWSFRHARSQYITARHVIGDIHPGFPPFPTAGIEIGVAFIYRVFIPSGLPVDRNRISVKLKHTDWTETGGDVVRSTGNVGIGATPPSLHSAVVNLSLGGNATISGDRAPSAGAVLDIAQNVYFNTSAAWTKLSNDESSRYHQGGGVHTFYTAPSGTGAAAESAVMVITDAVAGKVGIGTTDPGAGNPYGYSAPILEVSGTDPSLRLKNGSNYATIGLGTEMIQIGTNGDTTQLTVRHNGSIGIGTGEPASVPGFPKTLHIRNTVGPWGDVSIRLENDVGNNLEIGMGGTKIQFYFNSTMVMSIDSSGNLTVLGNVTSNTAP